MSANNFYYIKKIGSRYYGWDEMAEESGVDDGVRKLKISEADAVGKTVEEVKNKLDQRGIGYADEGITTAPYLPKDGTPIEIIHETEYEDADELADKIHEEWLEAKRRDENVQL